MIYRDLNHALGYLKKQVEASLPYALHKCPKLSSPEAIFNWLKLRTTYKHDPRGIELFQSLQTLLGEANFHKIRGAGDCDCFTIAALALLLANGFTDCGIVLAGRSPLTAVHIWAYCNYQGRRVNLDLTNAYYNQTRHYPYTQHIPYVLNQKEKSMLLQLAEGNRKRGRVNVSSHSRRFPLHEGGQSIGSPYIYFPQRGLKIREDYYDNLSAGEFQKMCLSEGLSVPEIIELSAKRAERKAAKQEKKATKVAAKTARKENRQTARVLKKETKQAAKVQKKESRPIRQFVKGRAERKIVKQQGKADSKIARQQGRADARFVRAEGRASRPRMSGEAKSELFKGIVDVGGGLVNAFTGVDIPRPFAPEQSPKPGEDKSPGFFDQTIDIFGMTVSKPVAALSALAAIGITYKVLSK